MSAAAGAAPTAAETRTPHQIQVPWLGRHVGKMIRVGLVTGKAIIGELVGYDQFTLELRQQPGTDTAIFFKHAVAYIAPAEAGGRA